jgi:actin related protein 2/3 complex subunit 1A/1B
MSLKAAQQDQTKFLDCITCHAFNKDRSQVALCPNNSTIEIYETKGQTDARKWTKIDTLTEHSGLVSDLDWEPSTNRILSCGHDRNAYVWNLTDGKWKPTLCVLRINRAAITSKWAPCGKKFAVTSGSKTIPVCYYEASSDWWVSRIVKKHRSTIVDCAWSPNSNLLITASTDFKCRIVSAFLDEKTDTKDSTYDAIFGEPQYSFGEVLAEFDDAKGWVNCVAWSPSGKRVCFFGHGSTAHFVDLEKDAKAVQTIYCDKLPFLQCTFIDDNTVVAAGFDNNPAIFAFTGGEWKFKEFFQKESDVKQDTKAVSASSAAFARFAAADSQGQKFGETKKATGFTTHQAQINNLKHDKKGTVFTTSGVDGRVETWDAKKVM